MNDNLKTAIVEFIANEFKLEPSSLGEDFSFAIDLNLTPPEILDLLQRIQDALDFTLPEDKVLTITSLEDLSLALDDTQKE